MKILTLPTSRAVCCCMVVLGMSVNLKELVAQSAVVSSREKVALAEALRPVIQAHQGQVAVAVEHLATGTSFLFRADEPMPTASLIKFPVMIAAYQLAAEGKVDLARLVVLKEEDKVPGSGILTQHFSAGASISLRDAIRLMIVYSDNTATNLVIDAIGLPTTTEQMTKLELPHTRLHSKVFRGDTSVDPARSKQFGLGSTTAGEMLQLLKRLHQYQLVSAEASKQMFDHLTACDDKSRLGRYLNPKTKIALKTGSVSASRTVAGIIDTPSGPIAICVLTAQNKDQRWTDDNAAQLLSAEIAHRAVKHFNPNESVPQATPQELAIGANGEQVEALQRTLNARANPSPGLAVDGDFGPATKKAVEDFQRSKKLPVTGVVDSATKAALGLFLNGDEAPGKQSNPSEKNGGKKDGREKNDKP